MPSNTAAPVAAPWQPPAQPLRIDGRPLQNAEDIARYFGVEISTMLVLLYKTPDEKRYRHFEIPKRSGGMRNISAPRGPLRDLQDKLHIDLKRLYEAHPRAHGFIEKRSIVTNAADHAGKRWVLNVDLVDFFPSINFGRVRGLFMKPPFEMAPAAATICAQIVTYRNGLPQGAPTSPVLSNFIASSLDRMLLRLARQNGSSTRATPTTSRFRPTWRSFRRQLPFASRSPAVASRSQPAMHWSRRSRQPASRSTPARCASRAGAYSRA